MQTIDLTVFSENRFNYKNFKTYCNQGIKNQRERQTIEAVRSKRELIKNVHRFTADLLHKIL